MAEPKAVTEICTTVNNGQTIYTKLDAPDIVFYDVRRAPFDLYNFYDPINQPIFCRVPEDVAAATSKSVEAHAKRTAGGRVRFSTDSEYIAISTKQFMVIQEIQPPLIANVGFDLYEDTDADSKFIRQFTPPKTITDGYEQIIRLNGRKMRSFTIHFPMHCGVESLYIGLQRDAKVGEGRKYLNESPIVIYGSSIVHGVGVTRSGLVYSNMLCRRLNRNVFNLGFSGAAKAENAIVEYISGLDMEVFVCDYDHNARNAEYLAQTHRPLYEKFRAKHPDTPFIMISRPNGATNPVQVYERRDVIIDTYRYALSIGDRHVYYIDGETFFLGRYENDCTVDGVHPNELGYALMADGIEAAIRRALREKS